MHDWETLVLENSVSQEWEGIWADHPSTGKWIQYQDSWHTDLVG